MLLRVEFRRPFRKLIRLVGLAALSLAASTGSPASAQSAPPKIAGDFENYFLATSGAGPATVAYEIRWLSLRGDVNPHLQVVAGELEVRGRDQLDETHADYTSRTGELRVGRIRSAFGFSDWSEEYYAGFTHLPLLRVSPLGSVPNLVGLNAGGDFHWGNGAFQNTVALVDIHPAPWAVTPARPRFLISRTQLYDDPVILGFNLMVDTSSDNSRATRLFDLDGRWSAPHLQCRGEILTGVSGGTHPFGYYADLFYHPPRLTRTTFVFRTEGILGHEAAVYSGGMADDDRPVAQFNTATTVGLKQILTRYFTLDLSYAPETAGQQAESLRGFAAQLLVHLYL